MRFPYTNQKISKFNIMKKQLINFAVIGLIFSIALVSCKKDQQPAPQLPPEASFLMNFSDFSNPGDTATSRDFGTYQNWGHAYTNVIVWSVFIKVGLAVPVAAFVESFKHEAVYHPAQHNWTWNYNFNVAGVWHEAELTGYIESDTVNWEMRITKDGEYNDFLWYYGKNSFDLSGGYWILYEKPVTPNELLRIDWNNQGGGIANIKYTNIVPEGPENGGYIHYGTQTGDLNLFYDIYNKGQNNLTEIEWNSEDYHGHVKDPKKFGDSDWHCWNIYLQDDVCP